ncbi:SDR family oxidoreductase [Flavihumibacter rivuli]|uniref:SDR family oxidoreductase n=1 Tax=Flavihumibacter rivuli TaxID=2838156 RepID=UPI001BDEA8F4|nr:SDR family oxidoreductase [Flavihumibacter rivuli]ULQ57412.1 SDR family oxidoreductase [Flavihumibacter rivuli]
MDKVLVTGANGLLGHYLINELAGNGFEVVATGKGKARLSDLPDNVRYFEADITHPFALRSVIEMERPGVVVHAAAMTQVDECEQQQSLAHVVNVEATARLLLDAEEFSSFFVFVSTDFVFDGLRGMYTEEDDTHPVNWYGHTKQEAEAIVHTSSIPWAIVRTCLVYGNIPHHSRTNIVTWVKQSLEEGKEIKVVNDQFRTPTYAADLAKGIRLVIQQRAEGIWHISGEEPATPYVLANKVAEFFNLDKTLIREVNSSTFSQPGKRPSRTGFDIAKAKAVLGYQPLGLDDGLKLCFGK